MYSLVADVESYPTFLPWCRDAEVTFRKGKIVEATLELHKGRVSKHFRTRNSLHDNQEIVINLVDGPFHHLAGQWRFEQLGETGCKVSLDLDFEFESRIIDMLIGAFFEDSCNSLVDAFTRRATEMYGDKRARDE